MSVHSIFNTEPASTLTDDDLERGLLGHASQIASLTARFLELLAEFDTRQHGWAGTGILSCAHWLSWRTGMTLRTAQDHVRVARALVTLPLTRAAFHTGELTYSKVRALTRAATPEREPELIRLATSTTADQLERVIRTMRDVERDKSSDATDTNSSGRWKWNYDGTLSVSLRLTALDGASFLAAVVRAEYERTRTEDDADVPRNADEPDADAKQHRDLWRHVPADIAPAVVAMSDTVRTVIAVPGIVPASEVIIHTHVGADPHLDNGPALSENEAAQAQCGAKTSTVTNGVRLYWGRERRTPNRRLVQLIVQRDRTCRHPSCGRTRHLHIHHVKYWSHGGKTDPDNLILLCSTHHRGLHQGAFAITAQGKQRFTFSDPAGTLIETAPPNRAPARWQPNPTVANDATVPVGGGRLNLAYAMEVLYRRWDSPARQAA